MRVLRTGWVLTRPLSLVPLLYHTVYTKRIVVESTLHQRLLTKEVVSTIMLSLPLLVWNHCWLNCWSPTAKAWLFYFCCNPQKVLASNQDCCWGQSPLDAPSCWALVDTLSNSRPFHVFILLFLRRLILNHVDHPVTVDLNQALLYHFCGLHHFQPCWESWVSSDSLRILCWSGTHVDVVLPAVLSSCFDVGPCLNRQASWNSKHISVAIQIDQTRWEKLCFHLLWWPWRMSVLTSQDLWKANDNQLLVVAGVGESLSWSCWSACR